MKDVKKIGDIIIEKGPYCAAYQKRIDENCWKDCSMYCRYREVRRDEDRIARGERCCRGYKTDKWKHMTNYFYYVGDTKIVDVPDFIKEDNDND